MGFFSKLAKEAAKQSKARAQEQRSSANWDPPQVSAPIPTSGDPYEVKVKSGKQILLRLNLKDLSDEAVDQLKGRYSDEDEIEKSVRLVMFRDLQSQYADSVRVVTTKGHLVGWVRKDDSAVACTVIDQITMGVHRGVPESAGRPIHLNVSAFIEGSWDEDEDDNGKTIYVASIDSAEIRIKNPAEVE